MSGPDRIWAFDYDLQDNDGTWRNWQCWSEDHPKPLKATEYIRRDPAVLAALPEVQAMIAAEREACLAIISEYAENDILKPASGWPDEEVRAWNNGGLDHLLAVAAAIRKRGEG